MVDAVALIDACNVFGVAHKAAKIDGSGPRCDRLLDYAKVLEFCHGLGVPSEACFVVTKHASNHLGMLRFYRYVSGLGVRWIGANGESNENSEPDDAWIIEALRFLTQSVKAGSKISTLILGSHDGGYTGALRDFAMASRDTRIVVLGLTEHFSDSILKLCREHRHCELVDLEAIGAIPTSFYRPFVHPAPPASVVLPEVLGTGQSQAA